MTFGRSFMSLDCFYVMIFLYCGVLEYVLYMRIDLRMVHILVYEVLSKEHEKYVLK